MITGNGNIMMVKCDRCGKEAEAPESIAVLHFSDAGWDLFNRDEGELMQICDDCMMKHLEVIDVDEMRVV